MTIFDLKSPTLNIVFVCLVAITALVALATVYAAPLADIDIWWHLATGRHLMQTGEFLSADPFGLAGGQITPGREIILNGYWLSQILFYGLYELFGLAGIVALRVVLLLIPPCVILAYGWRRSFSPPAVLFLALLCGWGMVDVSGIRPNHLTVAFVPLFFVLLAEIGYSADWKEGGGYDLRKAWLLPFFMLLWANLHGGFLLGVVLIVLYATSETLTFLWCKHSLKPIAKLWVVVATTMLASLLTPNGISVYVQYLGFQGGALQQKTSEYLSPLILAQSGVLVYWPYFILLFLCLMVLIVGRFRMNATRLLLLLAMAALSLTAFRYASLFVGAAPLLLIPEFSKLAKDLQWRRVLFNLLSLALVCFLLVSAVVWYPRGAGALSKGVVDSARFPIAAADFIKQKKLTGVVFNHFNWGGYLAWREAGRITTFIDGRSLNLPLFHAYTRALWLPEEMQSILDQRGVDLILMPRLNPFTGELYTLTDFLWKSSQWVQIYHDHVATVFIRSGRHPELEMAYGVDKNMIYEDVLMDVVRFRAQGGGGVNLKKASRLAKYRLGK